MAISGYLDILSVLSRGLYYTISILIVSAIIGYIIAFVAGFGRISRFSFIRRFTMIYVEFFRGTSLIVQLFWFYYVLPLPNFWAGTLAIGLNYGAYMSEIVRGSILAVPKGQTEASIALNMSNWQRMRLVILPQALRMMLPEFGNYLIQMVKATSLVSLIGLTDITYQAMVYRASNIPQSIEVFVILLIVYFLIALPLIALTRWLERMSSKGVARE